MVNIILCTYTYLGMDAQKKSPFSKGDFSTILTYSQGKAILEHYT